MNKQDYLKRLEEKLINHHVLQTDINDILSDYDELYQQALDRGLSDEAIYHPLGNPIEVYRQLKPDL